LLSQLSRIMAVVLAMIVGLSVAQAADASLVNDAIISVEADGDVKGQNIEPSSWLDLLEVTLGYDGYAKTMRVASIDIGKEMVRTQIEGVERYSKWNELQQVELAVSDWSALDGVAAEAIWAREWTAPEEPHAPFLRSAPLFRYSVDGSVKSLFHISKVWLTPEFLVLAAESMDGIIEVRVLKYSVVDWFEARSVPE
jgi:hypothetical protein